MLVYWAPAVGLALSSAPGTQPRKRWVLMSQSPPPSQGAQANPGKKVGLAVWGEVAGLCSRGGGGREVVRRRWPCRAAALCDGSFGRGSRGRAFQANGVLRARPGRGAWRGPQAPGERREQSWICNNQAPRVTVPDAQASPGWDIW